jgi:predicted outer membrane repeat protein
VTVTDCTFSGNSAATYGGGIYNFGGIVKVSNSTLSGNSASADNGGGIENATQGTLTVTNSTLSGNSAGTLGGGICNDLRATATVTSCTLSANSARAGGGISNTYLLGTVTLGNTIVAGNTGGDISGSGTYIQTYSLVGGQPRLAPLGDNGGPTQTMPLLAGSPALDAGDPALAGAPDQRGVVRSGGVNIGAYQASASALVLTGLPSSATAGTPLNVTTTAVDPFGQTALGYTGTVHFTSSDPQAALPGDYTFTSADAGVHTFSITLKTAGSQSITATDTASSSITGTQAAITVTPAAASALFVKADPTTQGSWQGVYGGDGYNVIGATAANPRYPSYAQVTPAGTFDWTWAASAGDFRALQKPGGSGDRVAAAWYGSTFTVDINLTDGQSHPAALYLLDWDGAGRSERIDVLDAASGSTLDSRTVSGFQGGQYLVYNLSGHVQVRVTALAGANAVLSGLFFGPAGTPPPAAGSAAFVPPADVTTGGGWQGVYGGDGYDLAVGPAGLPAYAQVGTAAPAWTWAASTSDARALQQPGSATARVAAAWYGGTFTVDVRLTDGGQHRVALYLVDWDGAGRSERVDVLDAAAGTVLSSQTVSGFQGGQYLVVNVSGHVLFRFATLAGPNAVLSGLFFGPAGSQPSLPSPSGSAAFVKADATTQGTWQGAYGALGYDLAASASSLPPGDVVALAGAGQWTWAASTSDGRALQQPTGAGRLAAAWFGSSFSADVNLGADGNTHQVALYLVDWDNQGRTERVDVFDAASGVRYDTRTVSAFGGGVYLVFNVSGHVRFQFTSLAGPNAVLSGLFLS